MKVVEFIGLPGSGKSTLAHRLHGLVPGAALMDRDGEYLVARAERPAWRRAFPPAGLPAGLRNRISRLLSPARDDLAAYGRFVATHPDYERRTLDAARRQLGNAGAESGAYVVKRAFEMAATHQRLLETRPCRLLIMDPGFYMRVTSAFGFDDGSDMRAAVREHLSAAPRPAKAFVLSAPPELCATRLSSRPRGWPARFLQADASRRQQVLERMAVIVVEAAAALEEMGVPLARIDGAAHLSDAALLAEVR